VVSGCLDALETLEQTLTADSIQSRRVNIAFAAHSAFMNPILGQLEEALADLRPRSNEIPFYSSLLGAVLPGEDLDAAYWRRNVRDSVQFGKAAKAIANDDFGVFIELGGHPVLTEPLLNALRHRNEAVVVASARRDFGGLRALKVAAGQLHAAGHPVDWTAVLAAPPRLANLPTYAFQRTRHWLDTRTSLAKPEDLGLCSTTHPLLSTQTQLAHRDAWMFSGQLSRARLAWLGDHEVFDTQIVPGTALLEMAHVAARACECPHVEELALLMPMVLPSSGRLHLQIQVEAPNANGERKIEIYSRPDNAEEDTSWTQHASGCLTTRRSAAPNGAPTPPNDAQSIDLLALYPRLRKLGLGYGPRFQGLREAYIAGDDLFGRVALDDALKDEANHYSLHPALLDAALHLPLAAWLAQTQNPDHVRLPFAWSKVNLAARGATELWLHAKVVVSSNGEATMDLTAANADGEHVLTATLSSRPAQLASLRRSVGPSLRDLYRVDWLPVTLTDRTVHRTWFIDDASGLAGCLPSERFFASVQAVQAELNKGTAAPERIVLVASTTHDSVFRIDTAHKVTARVLDDLQTLLTESRLSSCVLVCVTNGAVSTGPEDEVKDLPCAGVWGLVRTARSEALGRVIRLVDISGPVDQATSIQAVLVADEEPELALRFDATWASRLVRAVDGAHTLTAPSSSWRVEPRQKGTLTELTTVDVPVNPLPSGYARVEVRAAGVNFRDVLNVLDMVPAPWLGLELAGIVTECADDVTSLRVGDRVMGLGEAAFATHAVADARLLTRMPSNLSFEEAATVPLVFLTALYGFRDLANLTSGQRVLVHAAAGGVGMAAVQLAQAWGAEVFATASPAKWDTLHAMGIEDDHIANSRHSDFKWSKDTKVDVVLNALTGDMIDASLAMLRPGGHFLEIGKTDLRNPAEIKEAYGDVQYRVYDLVEAGPEGVQRMLNTLADWLQTERIKPLPLAAYDLRHTMVAFRHMAKARHLGKIVLHPPRRLDAEGTVLITGGVGELGRAVAAHLVEKHGVRHLLLTSRRGMDAPGADEVISSLLGHGATSVRIVACDVADHDALSTAINGIDTEHPLTGVYHLAGVLDDGLFSAMTADQLSKVLRPKVDGAWHLHTLTAGHELGAFVLFSSFSGIMGGPGQANYAAANAFIDALAAFRRSRGLAGTSLAWGLWAQQGIGMTAHLSDADIARMQRQGLGVLSFERGLELLDGALARPEATLVPVPLDLKQMQSTLDTATVPGLLRRLVKPAPRKISTGTVGVAKFRKLLIGRPAEQARADVLAAVQEEISVVLGLSGSDAVSPQQTLQALGIDSLMGIELRNRLSTLTGLDLPTSLALEFPTPQGLAGALVERMAAAQPEVSSTAAAAQSTGVLPAAVQALEDESLGVPFGFADEADYHQYDEFDHYGRAENIAGLRALGLDVVYTEGEGNYLEYQQGRQSRRVLDLVGGFGGTLLGHNHPELIAVAQQMLRRRTPFLTNASNRAFAGRLSRTLAERVGASSGRAFVTVLCNSGAETVEASIKHARMEMQVRAQEWISGLHRRIARAVHQHDLSAGPDRTLCEEVSRVTGRCTESTWASVVDALVACARERFETSPTYLTVERAFHGKTSGALSLTAHPLWRRAFGADTLATHRIVPNDIKSIDRAFDAVTHPLWTLAIDPTGHVSLKEQPWCTAAGLWVEPVQGEGGIYPLEQEFLEAIRERAHKSKVPVIADEIQCGLGRTGAFTASERFGLQPDYYLFAKALGGGMSKVGALVIDRDRYLDR
ncbi:MAG: aminotransferase class III-fold pyridoxal phosphate-dependent enzyme, partial [Myxococcota bacterium]